MIGGSLLFSSLGLAAQVHEYPWYFYPNNILEVQKIFDDREEDVVFDILDSQCKILPKLDFSLYIIIFYLVYPLFLPE